MSVVVSVSASVHRRRGEERLLFLLLLLLFSLRLSLFSLGSDVECTACGLEPLHGVGIKCTGHLQWSFPVVNPALGGRDREEVNRLHQVSDHTSNEAV